MTTAKLITELEVEVPVSGTWCAPDPEVGIFQGYFDDVSPEGLGVIVTTHHRQLGAGGFKTVTKAVDLLAGLDGSARITVLANLALALDDGRMAQALDDEMTGDEDAAAEYRHEMRGDGQ